mmetsp:Transcript_34635/g.67018  ORF Transcript_34635/g.67018 Transcript_34635/m.67018 type:complete len:618 (-) Transcript_34635:151-2004(-)
MEDEGEADDDDDDDAEETAKPLEPYSEEIPRPAPGGRDELPSEEEGYHVYHIHPKTTRWLGGRGMTAAQGAILTVPAFAHLAKPYIRKAGPYLHSFKSAAASLAKRTTESVSTTTANAADAAIDAASSAAAMARTAAREACRGVCEGKDYLVNRVSSGLRELPGVATVVGAARAAGEVINSARVLPEKFPYVGFLSVGTAVVHMLELRRIHSDVNALQGVKQVLKDSGVKGIAEEIIDRDVSQLNEEYKIQFLTETLIKGMHILLVAFKLDSKLWEAISKKAAGVSNPYLVPLLYAIARGTLAHLLELPGRVYRTMAECRAIEEIEGVAEKDTAFELALSCLRNEASGYLIDILIGATIAVSVIAGVEKLQIRALHVFFYYLALNTLNKAGSAPRGIPGREVSGSLSSGPTFSAALAGSQASGIEIQRVITTRPAPKQSPQASFPKFITERDGNTSFTMDSALGLTPREMTALAKREGILFKSWVFKILPVLSGIEGAFYALALSQFAFSSHMFKALGFSREKPLAVGLELFLVACPPITYTFFLITRMLRRYAGYNADYQLAKASEGDALGHALQKLYRHQVKEGASMFAENPTDQLRLIERIRALAPSPAPTPPS